MGHGSKDAERILRIPARHLPAFAGRVQELAADTAMTFDKAVDILAAELKAAGVTMLDFEMAQPGNAMRVPFAISRAPSAEGAFQAAVSGEVERLLGGIR